MRSGLLKTTNGGTSWTTIDGSGTLTDKNISGIAVNGSTVVVSVDYALSFSFANIGIFRSTDGGTTFSQISSGDGTTTGLPGGLSYDLAFSLSNPTVLYTVINYSDVAGGVNGIYKSTDTGATWTKVSSSAMDALLTSDTTSNVEISVGNSGAVNVAILNSGQLRNGGVFRSDNGNAGTWEAMDTLLVNETGGSVGTNPRYKPDAGTPGGQGAIHFSILTDNTDGNIVYIGGDRQPRGYNDAGSWPNALGANNYTGRLFRGDASVTATGAVPSPQWKHLTHTQDAGGMTGGGTASNSAPHADSREMVFDASGNIIQGDDGGIYRRTSPGDNTGDWFSINGNLQVTEQHDIAYDTVSNIIISGNQDTGTTQQSASQSTTWDSVSTADGGDVAVSVDPSNSSQSIRYSSFQYLGSFLKLIYDASGNYVTHTYPALTVSSGDTFTAAFITPVEVNQVNANKLLFGGTNGLYESSDQGETIRQLTAIEVNSSDGGNMMVYGGQSEGVDNEDLVYAAVDSTDVTIKTTTSGSFSNVTVASSGDSIRGVIADPEEWKTVFAIDSDQVFFSTNAGTSWTDITGDLATALTSLDLRGIEYARNGTVRALLVGTHQGVYAALASDNYASWSKVGSGLPNAPVWDMDYDSTDDVLVVGTLGRGAWKMTNVSQTISSNVGFLPSIYLLLMK
jgi:hypothetical protein